MTDYDRAERARLIAEARQSRLRPDDTAIDQLRAALERDCADTPVAHLAHDAQAALWQLQQIANTANLSAMADQLEAAQAEIERLSRSEQAAEHWHAEVAKTAEMHNELGRQYLIIEAERDKLRAEVAAMRPMVEAAEKWRRWSAPRGLAHRSSYDDALIGAVDAYRAARDKAGERP